MNNKNHQRFGLFQISTAEQAANINYGQMHINLHKKIWMK
jgi:hypothetical protein